MSQFVQRGHARHSVRTAANAVLFEGLEGRQMMANILPDLNDLLPVNIPGKKSILIPLTANDADGDKLTYTVSSSNKNIQGYLHKRTNPFIRMHVRGKGVMEFQLLADVAPNTVSIIKGLIQAEYYDGLTFHRVIKDFMIQGGDQAGTGSGFFPYKFEDEYHKDVFFTGKYQLAMANSGNDTNGSQFFITTGTGQPPRHLDFNHTIFGQLVRGQHIADDIADDAVSPSDNKPLSSIYIDRIELIENHTDAVLMVKAPAGVSGTVTVKVSDGNGGHDTETFNVTGIADPGNAPPIFIKPIPDFVSPVNQTITLDLKALDIEGDVISFGGSYIGERHFEGTIQGNKIILFPERNYRGLITIKPVVQQAGNANTDEYTIVIAVGDKSLTSVKGAKSKGTSGKLQRFTVGSFKDTDRKSTPKEFQAMIYWGDGTVSGGVITRKGGVYSITGKHQYPSEGSYPVKVAVTSKGGATAYMNSTVNVADAPLTAKSVTLAGTKDAALSNVVVATFTDADPRGKLGDFTATIDWGDGDESTGTIQIAPSGGFQVLGSHTYTTGGAHPVKVTIKDKGGSKAVVTYNAIIGRASLVVNADGDVTISEGATYTRSATFTDATGTSWTGTVDWGDGSAIENLVINQETRTFDLSHKYENSGTYRVVVIIRDETGQAVNSGSDSYRMSVTNVGPAATIPAADSTGVRGQVRTIQLAATDPSPLDTAAGFRYQVDWGDGSSVQFLNTGSTSATHIFNAAGAFTVKVRAIDKDGTFGPEVTTPMTISSAVLQPSPEDATKTDLIVGGSTNAEIISVEPTAVANEVLVKIGGTEVDTFTPTGRVRVFGGAGNDTISILDGIAQPVELYGEAGSDALIGGDGNDLLVGGAGDDTINGNAGRDVLVGGAGKDELDGGDGEDLLISAATRFDSSPQNLATLVSEWSRIKSYSERIAHLLGTKKGGVNAFALGRKSILSDTDIDTLAGAGSDDFFLARTAGAGIDALIGKLKREVLFAL